jgi:hypothetical protein
MDPDPKPSSYGSGSGKSSGSLRIRIHNTEINAVYRYRYMGTLVISLYCNWNQCEAIFCLSNLSLDTSSKNFDLE